MNSATDNEVPPLVENSPTHRQGDAPLPSNWREALLMLISSRVALIQLESKVAATRNARRVIYIAAVVICAFFTWALMLTGGIGAVSAASSWPWYWVAMGAGALHLIVAIALAKSAKSPVQSSFPITRAEFRKDREWIENFQKKPKSSG